MSKPIKPTKTIEVTGETGTVYQLKVLKEPPSHLMFMQSELTSAAESLSAEQSIAVIGGYAAMVIREMNGEPIELEKTPRELKALIEVGAGCYMLFDELTSTKADIQTIFQAVLASYSEIQANPT